MSILFKEAEKYIFDLFNKKLDHKFVYHNLAHTQRVVEKVQDFIESLKLSEIDAESLLLAAWFHDAGFVKGAEKHEQVKSNKLTKPKALKI